MLREGRRREQTRLGRDNMLRTRLLIILLITALMISACVPSAPTETPVAVETPVQTLPPSPSITPTPVVRTLNICLGGEPNSLYLYGSPNSPARSVLSAIYDGPIDIVEY